MALADFVGDDAGLLIACRRLLDRQPSSAPLVWLAAHILGAPDQRRALWDAVEELEADQTMAALAFSLPDDPRVATVGWRDETSDLARKRGDSAFVLIDPDGSVDYQIDRLADDGHDAIAVDVEGMAQAMFDATHLVVFLDALGPAHGLASLGSFAAAAVAQHLHVPVWGVAATGVALGERMYGGLARRWSQSAGEPRYLRDREEIPVGLFDQIITPKGPLPVASAASGSCPIVPELF